MALQDDARFWDRTARKYAADPIADTGGYERTLDATRQLLKSSDLALEFGCGTGTTALRLSDLVGRILATDLSPEMIAIAREKAAAQGVQNVTFEVGTFTDARPEAAFDVVLAFNLLHLVRPLPDALRAVNHVLRPGGLFISKTPCLKLMNPVIRALVPAMRLMGLAPSAVNFFTADELEQAIAAVGFEILERGWHATRGKDARVFFVVRKR
jgi:ubiquinone/menaquinone biosynthesis C-methylase UbiE